MKKPATDGTANGLQPRLLDLHGGSVYTGIPVWSLRRLAWSGAIAVVKLPCPGRPGAAMRRIWFDRRDLDALIEQSKERLEG